MALWAGWFGRSLPARPMRFAHFATFLFRLLPLVLQSAIVIAMLRRRLHRVFPIFFSYTVLVPARDALLLFFRYSSKSYSVVYWVGDAVAIMLSLSIILEVVRHLGLPHNFLRGVFKGFCIAVAVAAAMALVLLPASGYNVPDPMLALMMLLERSVRFLQVCLLSLVILMIWQFGLTWHHYSVGITAGFGIYSACDLALLEFRGHLQSLPFEAFVLLRPAAYNLAALIWAWYFLKAWRWQPIARLPETDLAKWNEAISELQPWSRRF
jgi:hypothetical protein